MYCPNCGNQLQEGANYCPHCGIKLPERTTPAYSSEGDTGKLRAQEAETIWVQESTGPEPVQPPAERNKALIVLITCVIVGVLAVTALVFLLLKDVSQPAVNSEELRMLVSWSGEDGTAYIPLPEDGSCIVIHDNVFVAAITADRKHVVVLQNDGTLYVTDKKLSHKQIVADDVNGLYYLVDEGVFYQSDSAEDYRVLFSDNIPRKLDDCWEYVIAQSTASTLYYTLNGDIYTLPRDSTESIMVSLAAEDVDLLGISNDGQTAAWCAYEAGTPVLYLAENGRTEKLEEIHNSYSYSYAFAQFSKDNQMLVIADLYSDSLWIKKPGEAAVKVSLGSDCAWPNFIMTESSLIENTASKEISWLYVAAEGDDGLNILCVSPEGGDAELILSDVLDCCTADGYIFYIDMRQNLYSAKLNGPDLSEQKKIAGNVSCFGLPLSGNYVYYMTNCVNGAGDLYCRKVGDSSSRKIEEGVSYYGSEYGEIWTCLDFSTDGATVLYYKNMQEIEDTSDYVGTMKMWSYGDQAGAKISDSVIVYSPFSGFNSGEVDPKNFMFNKYTGIDSEDTIIFDMMYYDGKTVTTLAKNVA